MLYSPLDQFKIAPLISFVVAGVDLSFTNFLLASLLALFTLKSYVFLIKDVKTNSFFVIPSGWQNLHKNPLPSHMHNKLLTRA